MEMSEIISQFPYIPPLLAALLCGSILGIERELSHKPAGLRTQALVTIGTTLFVLGTQGLGTEIARIAANVITGLGFIGGGVILQHKGTTRGLTTAALIWVNGALGLAIGFREYEVAFAGAVLALVVLRAFDKAEHKISSRCHVRYYQIKASDDKAVSSKIQNALRRCHFQEEPLAMHRSDDGVEFTFAFCNPARKHDRLVESLKKIEDVTDVIVKNQS